MNLRISTKILVYCLILFTAGCSAFRSGSSQTADQNQKPGQTVEKANRLMEQGNSEEYKTLTSKKSRSEFMPGSVSEKSFSYMPKLIKGFGGIKSIEILKEDISGEKADVVYNYHYGNGTTVKSKQSLVMEDGGWKLDGWSDLANE